ncbi:MAG TPA: serine/threonine-protein kinase, partial [Anaerolineales bacterium]|nr:serine/threonine-protein kinase [Anaerolineales bacterium]
MDNLQSGQMLGPYRIITQIGKGGMANVYKAYQASVDRYVAIKVLPSQLAESQEFATRFHQEARIIAKLEHPHILPVFDYGETDGVAYFVMRYLEAGTLRDKMEAGRPLPMKDIDRIFTQLAEALSYAHSFGIIHRDLKPANALIDSHGNIFLTDFGIAKLLESASPRLTQTDAIMGTPAYISPEQAQSQSVDQRADIYSLGIILYEMVTGRVPFLADTPLAVLFKHISDPLPLPSLVKPDIPPSIEQVILKALAKDPKDRFSTAEEFVAAWKHALEEAETARHAPESSSTPTRYTVPADQTQRKPVPVKQATPKSGISTGWIVGCLAGACLL